MSSERNNYADGEDGMITRQLLLDSDVDTEVCVLDGKNLRRSLVLALQVAEFGLPMCGVVNLMDLPAVRPRKLPWASLLKRSLGVDGLECPRCSTQMVLLALISAPSTVAKILDHLRLPSSPPPVAPARLGDQQIHLLDDDLDQSDPLDDPLCASSDDTLDATASRAPP